MAQKTEPRRETGKPVTLEGSRCQPSRKELVEDQSIGVSPREVMRFAVRLRKVRLEK